MNVLKGTIQGIESSAHSSLVNVDVRGDHFFVVLLETPQTADYLKADRPVTLLFKESEVIIGKAVRGQLGLVNHMQAVVHSIKKGTVLTEVNMTYRNTDLAAIVPTKAADDLRLRAGETVDWFIKVNEITLQWKT